MVEALDAGVGEILAALRRLGLETNTLVVFTSDNGGDRYSRNAPFSHGKGTLGEGGLRVPCIARWPGKIPAGTVSAQPGITMDWTVTMLKLAGARTPPQHPLDGRDLLPVLCGRERPFRRTLFWRRVEPNGVETHRAVRDGNWKLVEARDGRARLYDLSRDLAEANDLAASQPARVARLRQRLDRWEAEVGPPRRP
jgi:arylsulfatase A-like enzyme